MNKNPLIATLALLITLGFLSTKVCDRLFLRALSGSEDKPTYIPLQKSDSGFYVLVNVSLNDNASEKDCVKMLISIYSSKSMLASQCLNFNLFDCQKYRCKYLNSTTGCSFPYFTGQGPSIKVDLGLGEDWNLNTPAVLSTKCINCELVSFGNEIYGIISLGVGGGNAWANYESKEPIFSLSFSHNGSMGELAFGKDITRIKPGTQPIVLHVDNNWRVQSVQGVKVGDYMIENLAKLMFDPNEDTIAFSFKTYELILIAFNNGPVPIKCNNRGPEDYYRPNCTYHGELKDLPNITVLAGNEFLIINPEQYVKDPETFNSTIGNLTLNIKVIYNRVHTPENHVTTDYKAYIIVGLPFLKDYYVWFNGTNHARNNNTIMFYIRNHEEVQQDSNTLQLIVPIIVVFVSFPIGVYLVNKKTYGQKALEQRLVANVEEEHHPIQIQNNPQNNNEESRVIQHDIPFNVDDPSVHTIPHQSEPFEPGSTLYFTK